MPIELLDQAEAALFPSAIDRLRQSEIEQNAGDPFERFTSPAQTPATLGEAWRARVGTTWIQGAADLVHRPANTPDPEFNPFRFIQSRPELAQDPAVALLSERGQFDTSQNEDAFYFDLDAGRRFLDDLDTLGRASAGKSLLTMGGVMLGDPINLLPLGAVAAAARTAGTAARVASFAGVGAGAALAQDVLTDSLLPAGNEPGLSDELLAAGAGAGIGGLFGLLTSPAIGSAARGLPTRKLKQLRRDFDRLVREPAVRPFDPALPTQTTALAPLADELARGRAHVESILAEDPVPNRVIAALHVPGDETAPLIEALRAKYAQAGHTLHVVQHPDQPFYEMITDVRKILDHPDLSAPATARELGFGALDSAVSALATRYTDLQSGVTPGGRLARVTLARLQDAYRTLSGSARTISAASARDPLNFPAGASAEDLKALYQATRDNALRAVSTAYASARRGGANSLNYDGGAIPARFGLSRFREAVSDLIRRENAVAAGFQTTIPSDVHLAIKSAAETVRGYFARMRDELERVGLLDFGPNALAEAKAAAAATAEELAAIHSELAILRGAGLPDSNNGLANAAASLRPRLAAQRAKAEVLARAIEKQEHYLPRVYNVHAILANPSDFKARLISAFRQADSIVAGKRVPDAQRPLLEQPAAGLDAAALKRAAAGVKDRPLVEGDLPPDLLAAYRAEVESHYRQGAESAFETLTRPAERHGVADALPSSPLKRRVLDIDEAAMGPYLERDLAVILERYHRVIGGRIATRRAIQLSPALWGGARLADGTPVTTGQHVLGYLRETVDALERFAQTADTAAKRSPSSPRALTPAIRTLRARVERDIAIPLDVLEGRHPLAHETGAFAAFGFFGRQLLRLSFVNKLGSVAISQINDLAPLTLHFLQRPRTLAIVPRMIRSFWGGRRDYTPRDLQVIGLAFDGVLRTRALSDTDYLTNGLGFGEGLTRAVTARLERGAEAASDLTGRVTLMQFITDLSKRVSGALVIDKALTLSKRALFTLDAAKPDEQLTTTLRRVGLTRYDLAGLNRLGLNRERSRLLHTLVYEHGLMPDDAPIRDAMSLDAYLHPQSKALYKPNFEAWPFERPEVRELFDVFAANVNGEVSRGMIVTPGVFDRPLINQTILGRMFNSLQSFGLAFTNQRLRAMAQMPASHQAWYAMTYLALGALADSISNHLSGRRTFEQTARMWEEDPVAATYAAWEKSGLAGWLTRPIAAADSLGVPFSPGNMLRGGAISTAARHVSRESILPLFGPVASDIDRAGQMIGQVSRGDADERTAAQAWKLAPWQNLIWLRLLHSATGAPVVPEAIAPPRPLNPAARP